MGICSGASEMHKGTPDLGAKLARREGWGSPRTTWEAGLIPCSEAIWADWGAALQHQTPDSHPLCPQPAEEFVRGQHRGGGCVRNDPTSQWPWPCMLAGQYGGLSTSIPKRCGPEK